MSVPAPPVAAAPSAGHPHLDRCVVTTSTPRTTAGVGPGPHLPVDGHRRHAAGRRAPPPAPKQPSGRPSTWSSGSPPPAPGSTRDQPSDARQRRPAQLARGAARALRRAARGPDAYLDTDGRFDPRVLEVLLAWGYDRSLPFASGQVSSPGSCRAARRRPPGRRRWRPRVRPAPPRRPPRSGAGRPRRHRQGPRRPLGGAARSPAAGAATLVEAGGDLQAAGRGPGRRTGGSWLSRTRAAARDPVAVLSLTDLGCATSSIRLRHWQVDGRPVHHLVDPRTGDPADSGLLSVTVVGPDVARAEVWSKALFLAGRGQVRRLADERGIAALLVDTDGVRRREPGDAAASCAGRPTVAGDRPVGPAPALRRVARLVAVMAACGLSAALSGWLVGTTAVAVVRKPQRPVDHRTGGRPLGVPAHGPARRDRARALAPGPGPAAAAQARDPDQAAREPGRLHPRA